MTARILLLGALLLLAFAGPTRSWAGDLNPSETFDQLKKLCGEWKGVTPEGRVEWVSYRLTANGTVLVETWTLGSGREALTLYHRDGEGLIATHYCPRGNQPRLKLTSAGPTSGFVFEFVSATNLPDPKVPHQRRFEIQIHGPDSFSRGETYQGGSTDSEKITYSRVLKPGS